MITRSIITSLLAFTCLSCFAQNWTGNVNSDWENPANWSGGALPANDDVLLIDSLSNYTGNRAHPIITVNSTFTPRKLTIENGGKLSIDGPAASLTVDGRNFEVNNAFSADFTTSLTISNGATLLILSDKKLTIKDGAICRLTGGTLLIEKDLDIDDGTFVMNESTGPSRIELNTEKNGKGKLKVKSLDRDSRFTAAAGSMLINAGDLFTIDMDGSRTGGLHNAIISIEGASVVNEGPTRFKNQIDDATIISVRSGSLELQGPVAAKSGSGKLDIRVTGGSLIFQDNLTLEPQDELAQTGNSEIRFQSTGSITNDGSINCTDGTVIFEGTTNLANNGQWQFNNLEIASGGILNQSTAGRVNVSGNWVNNGGTFSAGLNSITFNGVATQTIDVSANETFNDFTVSASAVANIPATSEITIAGIEQIDGSLNNDGIVNFRTGYDNNVGLLSGDGTHVIAEGNWNNIGTFTPESSEVVFQGSLLQRMEGTTEYNNLTINNSSGVSIVSGTHTVSGTVTPTSGTFNTNNSLILKSDANGTGRIMTIQPGADVIGEVEMQRFVEAGLTGWRMQTSAVQNQTLADWSDDFTTAGFTGSDYPSFSFVSIRKYDESTPGLKNSGWGIPGSIADPIALSEGFWVWSGNGLLTTAAFTIDNKGPINKGDISKDVSFTNSAGAFDDGWNLFGNPYPAPIDFDSPNWTKTNIDGTFWVWNTDTQSFASWTTIGSVGTNGGTPEIASSQAIWVKANAPGASITVRETCKTSNVVEFKSNPISEGQIGFKITGNGWQDESVLRFYPGGTENYDVQLDAPKMYSGNTAVPGIATVSLGIDYGVNTLSDSLRDFSIPVRTLVGATGSYTIEFSGIDNFPSSACLFFEDLELDSLIDLTTVSSYECTLADTTNAPRFLIHMSKPHNLQAEATSCSKTSDGEITATGNGNGPWTYNIYDSGNNLVHSSSLNAPEIVENLSSGVYYVEIINSGGSCTSIVEDSIRIESPLPIESNALELSPSCFNANDGEIQLAVSGGHAPYSATWSNGMAGDFLSGLSAGSYEGFISDYNGCEDTILVTLPEPLEVVSQFTSADTVQLSSGAADVIMNNISINSTEFSWNFGDGTTSNAENPIHTYVTSGHFTVSLTTENENGCSDTYTKDIVVLEESLTEISDEYDEYTLSTQLIDGQITLSGLFPESKTLKVKVFNIVGQESIPAVQVSGKTISHTFDISGLSKGIYLVSVSDNTFTEVFKVIHR